MRNIHFDCTLFDFSYSLSYHFDDKTLEPISPTLGPGDQLHIPIHQDESIFRSNELQRRVWAKDGKTPL